MDWAKLMEETFLPILGTRSPVPKNSISRPWIPTPAWHPFSYSRGIPTQRARANSMRSASTLASEK